MAFLCRKTGEKPIDPLLSWRDCVMFGLSASMQGWCFTTRLLAPTTPSLSPMPSGSAGKCQLRWPHQPSCGRRIMTASAAVQPAGWTIRQSGEMHSSILLLVFARLCSAQHFKHLLIRSVQGNCSCLAISEDSCCLKATSWLHEKLIFLSSPYQA